MCRGVKVCTELGADPHRWSARSPMQRKEWFDDAIDAFVAAYDAAMHGDDNRAVEALRYTRDRELNEWFDVHAQNASGFRRAHFGRQPIPERVFLDPVRRVTAFERELFARDGYRCRYCGVRVIPGQVTKRLQTILGKDTFDATSRRNTPRHGIKLVFSAALDHVDPHSRGGVTLPENLVTACWACNYGKAECTLAELGLQDPRDVAPVLDDWDGLMGITSGMV